MITSNSILAAVRFADGDHVDAVLEAAARALQVKGLHVDGFLQRETNTTGECCSTMHLEAIGDGALVTISQALGKGSAGCRLDPRSLAGLVGPLVARLDDRPCLLILNRFGKGETDGHGFRSAIERAYELGIPVLTAVRNEYHDAWCEFTGGGHTELSMDMESVNNWIAGAVEMPRQVHAA